MKALKVVLVLLALTSTALAGCLAGDPGGAESTDDTPRQVRGNLTTLDERELLPFDTTGDYSFTLEVGDYEILPVLDIYVPVEVPADEGLGAAASMARVHMGIWLPSNTQDGDKVPVIADVGPYYDDGDGPATQPARRLGGFMIQNFVPHGYAVAQVSVFGTGNSTHCMDLMGLSEQIGIDAAVEYLGTQEWSNGNVGLIGRSYDGSTPWEAATFGNPHLKTIVPISGLIGMHELMWRNGSAESRAPIMHNVVYGLFGIDTGPDKGADSEDAQTVCRDYLLGPVEGAGAYVTGDHFFPEAYDYWSERYFLERALENYKGSVYLIHGMQDWNVDPHMAFPTHHRLEAAGIEVKGLYGQWQHNYPDRPGEHDGMSSGRGAEAFPATVRYDWAQDLLEWFDHYLMETGVKPKLHAEIQDNMGNWRVEPTYPPKDSAWTPMALGQELHLVSGSSSPLGETTVAPCAVPLFGGPGGSCGLVFESEPVNGETRIAGLAKFHVQVTPTGPGGQLFARLDQVTEDGETLRLGHAIMDLRFAAGGTQSQPVVPGETITAMMEFEAFDVLVPDGATLRLSITNTGEGYLPSAISDPVIVETGANSQLILPIVERGPDVFFTPPPWAPVDEEAE